MKQDAAITELVGALLVVALIAGAVGIISVILISQPHPLDKVAGDFELKIDPVSEGAKVYISHVRGDPFQVTKEGEDPSFRVLVNGNEWPVSLSDSGEKNNFTLIKGQANSDYGEYYSSGDTLEAVSDEKPETVAFIEIKPDGSEYLLWSYGGNGKEANNVDFYGEPRVACIGEDVSFYDASTNNPDSWEWDFDVNGWDPATPHIVSGNDPNPVHNYAKIGKYTVSLTAGDPVLTETKTNYISVQPIVPEFSGTPLFGIDDSPDNPFIVTFTDLSRCGEGESWHWKYTDSINGGETTNISSNKPINPVEKFIAINDKVTKYSVNFTVYQDSVPYSVNKTNYITVCPKLKPAFSYEFQEDDPFTVKFWDLTSGDPNRWKWDFGDGATSTERNPKHKFEISGEYSVRLTVYNPCESGIVSDPINIIIGPSCENLYANFSWEKPESTDPYRVQFHSPLQNCGGEDCAYDIRDWEWDFGDRLTNTSGIREPLHEFPDGYDPTGTTVTLTVKNYVDGVCNKEASIPHMLHFNCSTLYPSFTVDPDSGPPGLMVTFTDNLSQQEDIQNWSWSFGDASSPYEGNSSNLDSHTPPPHTYSDTVPRIYTVLLKVKNSCNEEFVTSREVEITADASISGHLWDDQNQNGIEDSNEPALQGWKVELEKRDGSNWIYEDDTYTDPSGNYLFTPEVGTAVFRVKINYPSGQTWKTTYSYHSKAETTSGLLAIGAVREFSGVNFGNVKWKTSSITIPGRIDLYSSSGKKQQTYFIRNLADSAEYWEFTTSSDSAIRKVYLYPKNSQYGSFLAESDRVTVLGSTYSYSNWGNSSFTMYPREYCTYLKGDNGAHYLKNWKWKGADYPGTNFMVPDDTIIPSSELVLQYFWDSNVYFKFDKPKEGEIIPYTSSYRVETHYQGPYENENGCELINPVFTNKQFTYDRTIAEYWKNIDTRSTSLEGNYVQFKARMKYGSWYAVENFAYVNATIGWEPLIVTLTNVDSEVTKPRIKGITTVTGTVKGKWRDNANVSLIINNKNSMPMIFKSQSGTTSTFDAQFEAEPYAGKTIPLKIRAYPITDHGDAIDSSDYLVTALSKLPLIADFIADPWAGPAPLWVAFKDISVGGPVSWAWTFGDGSPNSGVQNPIKNYMNPGQYRVTLDIEDVDENPSQISKNIDISGYWNKTEVNSNRYSYIKSGGEIKWIATIDGSSITVNNTMFSIMSGDIVKLVMRSNIPNTENNRIEIGGGITSLNLSNVSLFVNGALMENGSTTAINMPDFQNYHSNLQLVADADKTKYALIKWGLSEWKTINKNRQLIVSDLMPDWNNTMSLYLTDGLTTFDGWASDYSPK